MQFLHCFDLFALWQQAPRPASESAVRFVFPAVDAASAHLGLPPIERWARAQSGSQRGRQESGSASHLKIPSRGMNYGTFQDSSRRRKLKMTSSSIAGKHLTAREKGADCLLTRRTFPDGLSLGQAWPRPTGVEVWSASCGNNNTTWLIVCIDLETRLLGSSTATATAMSECLVQPPGEVEDELAQGAQTQLY